MPTTDESSSNDDVGTYGYTVSDINTAFRHGHTFPLLFSSLVWPRKLRRFGLQNCSLDRFFSRKDFD